MQKGQISIDLLLTILAAVIILISFNGLITSSYLSQDKINTKQQLDLENEKIVNLITQTQMINDTNYTISTMLTKIYYLDENKIQLHKYPDINIQNNTLTLRINNGKEIIESTKRFSKNTNTKIVLGSTQISGSIVITNE
jgi:hypothetical protein